MITSELPVEVPTVAAEGDTTINPNVLITSTTTTIIETETRGPRTFLPNGSPSRPTVTATCRPQMWIQCVLEGQINDLPPEGTSSAESSLSEPYLLAGVPENLGHEWRILHPFEIPGVRFPTDNTPPNQRRLAENDALVERIQTTEYLEDTPTWGQRDYQFYPLDMVTLFIEEEEGAEEEAEEEENGWVKDHLKEKQTEGLEEVLPMEMEEDFILRPLQREIKEIGRRRNGQFLQVMEGEGEIFLFLPPQCKDCNIELHPLLLLLKIDFSWIGVV